MTNGDAGPSGIIPRKYKSGSIIYFEGDKSEYIYILKSGRVILTSLKLDTGEEVKEEVRKGEFFGVKSSLGKYPREETAQTIGDTVVLAMALSDFERLILRNSNVVRKMLRVFSNQLRRILKMERSVLGEVENVNADIELFRIGEYYYKTGVFQQAQYAYKRYMEYYPDAEYASIAMERINAIDSGEAVPDDAAVGVLDSTDAGIGAENASGDFGEPGDMLDFDDNVDKGDAFDDLMDSDSSSSTRSPLGDEMDDFLSDDGSSEFDDFNIDEPAAESGIFKLSKLAADSYSSGSYSSAMECYQKIIASDDISSEEEKKIFKKAHFEAGRCQMELGKPKDALGLFSKVIQKFPNSEYVKNSLFHIGLIFESVKQKDKAISYYNKVLNMSPKDGLNSEALNKIKNLQSS